MKRSLLLILCSALLLSFTQLSFAAEGQWLENIDQAKAVAAKENKHIFINFSGSDWCHWCIKLDKDILSQEEFLAYAEKNLVLLKVDFPKRTRQSTELREHNEALARTYQVRGFPTVIILTPKGEQVATTGYRYGSVSDYINHVKTLITQ
jgi:protein disulfide-isomerase